VKLSPEILLECTVDKVTGNDRQWRKNSRKYDPSQKAAIDAKVAFSSPIVSIAREKKLESEKLLFELCVENISSIRYDEKLSPNVVFWISVTHV